MSAIQKRNAELVDILRPDFQARYEPNFAMGNAVALFQSIPGLRYFWPMSTMHGAGIAPSYPEDLSGGGRDLTNIGPCLFGYDDLAPYVLADGINDYLTRADEIGLDVTGTEGYVQPAYRGLTYGGWFKIADALPIGFFSAIMSKYDTTINQKSYQMYINAATSVVTGRISRDGTGGTVNTIVSTYTLTQNQWHFIIMRFDPSTELAIMVDGSQNKDSLVAGVQASIFNSTTQLDIFAYNNGTAGYLNAYGSLCFISGMFLSDSIIDVLYQQTRALFGV